MSELENGNEISSVQDTGVADAPTGLDIDSAVSSIADDLGFANSGEEAVEPGKEEESGASGEKLPAETDPAAEAETAAQTDLPEPPKTWRKEALEHWAALPDTVRAEILKREDDIFRGLEGYKAQATVGRAFQEALGPFETAIRQEGGDPVSYVRNLVQLDASLSRANPEQRLDMMLRVAQAYDVDLYAAFGAERPYVDPQVTGLQQQLLSLQTQLQGMTQAQQSTRLNEATEAVNTFANNPENVYFNEVAPQMLELINRSPTMKLEEAYNKACRLNDAVWGKIQAAEAQKKAEVQRQKSAQHAATARRAASVTVSSSPRRGGETAPASTLEDTLAATLANIRKHSN